MEGKICNENMMYHQDNECQEKMLKQVQKILEAEKTHMEEAKKEMAEANHICYCDLDFIK